MKKKVLILSLICLVTVLLVALAASVYAGTQLKMLTVNLAFDGDVAVYVDGKYISDAPLSRYVGKGSTVKLLSESDDFMFYSDSTGNTFGYEGEYTFDMVSATTVDAWFENTSTDKACIIYKNTNSSQQILSMVTMRVSDIDTYFTEHLIDTANKFGYRFTSWNKTVAEIVSEAKSNGGTIFVEPSYESLEHLYTVELIDGTFASTGERTGSFQINTTATIVADNAPEGKKFAYWTNKAGVVISDSPSINLSIITDETYKANFVDEDATVELEPTVVLSAAYDKSAERVRTSAQRFVPDGYTLSAYGLVFAKDVMYAEDKMTLEDVDNVNLRMSINSNPQTASGIWVNTISCVDFVCVRAYIIYVDAEGESHTVYTSARTVSAKEEVNDFLVDMNFNDGKLEENGFSVNGNVYVSDGELVLESGSLDIPMAPEAYPYFTLMGDFTFVELPDHTHLTLSLSTPVICPPPLPETISQLTGEQTEASATPVDISASAPTDISISSMTLLTDM